MKNKVEIQEAIDSGKLYAMDVTDTTAYVYYEPNGIEHEHATLYVKKENAWVHENTISGDITAALGGDESEQTALDLLGLSDSHS